MATTATRILVGQTRSSPFSCRQSDRISTARFSYVTSSGKSLMIQASRKDESQVSSPDPAPFNSQGEDVTYVLKLVGGSVLGAAVIKYGSALFPQITTPNILLALSMISAPVILAIFLLVNKSRAIN
ncbi:hypothetical protein ACET3Z_022763 [Daucus carota]